MENNTIFSISATLKNDFESLSKRFPNLIKVNDDDIIFISSRYFKLNKILNWFWAPVLFIIGALAAVSAIIVFFHKGLTGDAVGIFIFFGVLPMGIAIAVYKYSMGYCKYIFVEKCLQFYNPFTNRKRYAIAPKRIEQIKTIDVFHNSRFVGFKIKLKQQGIRVDKLLIWLPSKASEVDLSTFIKAFETLLKQ
jgi:hypothetical protein